MRKQYIWPVLAVVLLLTFSVGTTLAYLMASPRAVKNTFTVGEVSIVLTETTGKKYVMAPGVDILKDPVVTVQAGSEDCWLFVKMEKAAAFDQYCTYEAESGWTALPDHEGVYYRQVSKSAANLRFHLLKNDRVRVKDSLTEEQLATIATPPTLTFTAYAIQKESLDDPSDAWAALHL